MIILKAHRTAHNKGGRRVAARKTPPPPPPAPAAEFKSDQPRTADAAASGVFVPCGIPGVLNAGHGNFVGAVRLNRSRAAAAVVLPCRRAATRRARDVFCLIYLTRIPRAFNIVKSKQAALLRECDDLYLFNRTNDGTLKEFFMKFLLGLS